MLESIKTASVVYDDINPQVPLYLRLYEAGLFRPNVHRIWAGRSQSSGNSVFSKKEITFADCKNFSYTDVIFIKSGNLDGA